jgi:hypothetical protein
MTEQEVKNEADMLAANTAQHLQVQFAALAHKHATVSYALIAVLVVVLILAGVGGYIGLRFADAQLAWAEKKEEQYNADRKAWQDTLAAHDAERAQESAEQKQTIAELAKQLAKPLPPVVVTGLKPGATAQEASGALTEVYKDNPLFGQPAVEGDKVALTVPQTQAVIQTKEDLGKTSLKLDAETKLFDLEHSKNESLNTDLTGARNTLKECQDTVNGYKKAAKASKFKKVLKGAGTAVAIIGGAYLGYRIGHH